MLRIAQRDLKAARSMLDADLFDEITWGFQIQQATEKALKAWIAVLGNEYPYTHDLGGRQPNPPRVFDIPGPDQGRRPPRQAAHRRLLITSFWHPDGKPMSSQQFIELLYGQLPEFVRDEAEGTNTHLLPNPGLALNQRRSQSDT